MRIKRYVDEGNGSNERISRKMYRIKRRKERIKEDAIWKAESQLPSESWQKQAS